MSKINFIHIPKNAGMTIRIAPELSGKISVSTSNNHISSEYTKELLATMDHYGEHHGYEHARWRDLNTEVQKNKSFAIIRNPWSKVVSRYTFGLKTGTFPKSYSFEEFLDERHKWGSTPYFWHRAIKGWYPQKDHVVDEHGILQCDIIRLENLDQDLMKYFSLSKMPRIRNISNGIKQMDGSVLNIRDYKEYYTSTTKHIIEDWYSADIDFFGFTFDNAATKNIWNK